MIGGILNIFRVPEIRTKLLITAGFLLMYRIGWNIPLPGIDLDAGLPDDANVLTLAFAAVNPERGYAGTVSGGVFKTSNGGASWATAGPRTNPGCARHRASSARQPAA